MPRHARPDVCRWLVLLDCLAELVAFVVFLFAYETQSQLMISDTLFSLPPYAIVLTVFLMVRIMFGVLYVASRRFADLERRGEDMRVRFAWAHAAAYAGFLVTGIGWVWLCRYREDPAHTTGVGGFVVGCVVSALALLWLAAFTERGLQHVHTRLTVAVLLAGGALAVAFVAMYFTNHRATWAVEHAAYALHLVFWGVFFSFHWHVRHVLGEEHVVFELGGVPQCQPLLPVYHVTPQLSPGE